MELSMPIATASVPTANAGKYVQQLCKHWSHTLQVTIEGEESDAVERMKGVVASHLDRFAFREAPLPFDWKGFPGG
jgi:hypothetical protein